MSKKYYQVFQYISLSLLVLPFLIYHPIQYNYTGILNSNRILAYICLFPNIINYSFLYHQNKPFFVSNRIWNIYCTVTNICMFITCIIPYDLHQPIVSNMHLLFGVISLVLLLVGLTMIIFYETKKKYIILFLLILDFAYITTCMSINGLSELIFALILFFALKKGALSS